MDVETRWLGRTVREKYNLVKVLPRSFNRLLFSANGFLVTIRPAGARFPRRFPPQRGVSDLSGFQLRDVLIWIAIRILRFPYRFLFGSPSLLPWLARGELLYNALSHPLEPLVGCLGASLESMNGKTRQLATRGCVESLSLKELHCLEFDTGFLKFSFCCQAQDDTLAYTPGRRWFPR